MQDRFKFRVPFFDWDDNFIGFAELDIINGLEPYNYGRCYHKELEQCTGLKDKNGKLIYENDFIQAKNGDIYLIEWCQEKLGFVARTNNPDDVLESLDISRCEWEVIGNIHENEDLLEIVDE